MLYQPIFLKVDKCKPHEKFWTARQSSHVVIWVKTKNRFAGNQIPFGGTRFGFVQVSFILHCRFLVPDNTQKILTEI